MKSTLAAEKTARVHLKVFQIKGIATTKELWIRAVKFNHLNFFSDRLNDHDTFSYQ